MRLLSFDTSGPWCAAALVDDGRVIGRRAEVMDRGQAERLVDLLDELLAETGFGWPALDALVCGTGPGNFTGVRISVAAARGLALALDRPAVGVSRLEAAAQGRARPCLVALDARRGEAWLQRFDDAAGAPMLAGVSGDWPLDGIAAAVGDVDLLSGRVPAAILHLPPEPADMVVALARIGAERLAAGDAPAAPAPLYLRPADAAPAKEQPPPLLP